MKKLPIGIQDFRELREGGYLYVDKTEQISQLIQTGKYYFLSRPRRFGKSLLISTLKEIFLGNRELFGGLWIENRYEWQPGPVIHLAFNNLGYRDIGLEPAIRQRLDKIAFENDVLLTTQGIALPLQELIEKLSKKGKVALLIDEYDKPIIDFLDDLPQALENREILKNFFSIIKEADPFLKFVLLTGVSKFSKVSIFSDLNNLEDISLSSQFNNLLGYTQVELESYFSSHLQNIVSQTGKTLDFLLQEIKAWYNGYNWIGPDRLYNPFSILNFFKRGQFQNFWFATGTPSFLVKQLKKGWHFELDRQNVGSILLDSMVLENPDFRSLLFQTGYLTILEQPAYNVYTLGFPNKEVKDSLLQHLVDAFAFRQEGHAAPTVFLLRESLQKNNLTMFFKHLDGLYGNIPERIFREKTEAAYHSVLYTALSLLGLHIRCEVATGEGYADAVIETTSHVYLMEFKVGKTPAEAIQQIREKRYAAAFAGDPREILAVGVCFGKEFKGVKEWTVEKID